MTYTSPSSPRSPRPRVLLLLLILVVGPLQAQNVFECSMMDTVMVGDCCCDGLRNDQDCDHMGCDDPSHAGREYCCELSVQLSVDQDARQDAPAVKPVEVRSGADPPPAIVITWDDFAPLPPPAAYACLFLPAAGYPVSPTWLTTRRLRI